MRIGKGDLTLLAAFMLTPAVRAQVDSGTITGTVTDASGSVIPAAVVRVVNAGDQSAVSLKTNDDGVYTAPSLRAGSYR